MNQATKSDMMNCIDRIRKTSNIVDGWALYGFMAALVVDDRTAAPLAIVGWPLLLGLTLPRGDAASAGSFLDRVAPVVRRWISISPPPPPSHGFINYLSQGEEADNMDNDDAH